MVSKRVLVTGASGFIGQPLVRALARAGYTVRAAMRRPMPFPNAVDVAIMPDFSNPVNWDPVLRDIEIVIHAAGHVHLGRPNYKYDLGNRINFMATHDLARAAARAGIEHFLFLSSVRAQSGASSTTIIREQDEPHPTNNYGRTKLAAELAVQAAGVPFTILRPVVVYGPHPKGSIKTMVWLTSLPLPLPFRNFDSQRSVLGIDNLISAIFFVLNNPATLGETYLVADPNPLTVSELVMIMRELQGRRPSLFSVPPKLLQIALMLTNRTYLWERVVGNMIVDTAKIESLGWHAAIETYDGLCAMLRRRAFEDRKGRPVI
jgi:nucleoside-diphosphate-sugar epimerase